MAHIRGSQADNALLSHLQHTMRTALYFSALDPSLIPVHLQTRRAQLLLEQPPLLVRVARWYARQGIDIPPEYTICRCHLQQPETWEHFKHCPLAQGGNHLATWTLENTIAQHAGWGPATPPVNEVWRLMRQPEIKEAVLRGAVPLQLYRVIADHTQNLGQQYVTCSSLPSRGRTHSYSTASRYTHRKHNKHPTTAAGIITSSSTTSMHSPGTSHTHGPVATARHLLSRRPERARPLPCRGPIVLQTIPLLRMPEGEAPHPRPGNPCGVCMEVNHKDGNPLLGHDLRCGGTEQLHWFCSPCITNLWPYPLCRRPHRLCTAPPPHETQDKDLTLQTLPTLVRQNVWNDAWGGDSPHVEWLDIPTNEDPATTPPHPPSRAPTWALPDPGRTPRFTSPNTNITTTRHGAVYPPIGNLPDSSGPVTPMNHNNYRTIVVSLTTRLPIAFGWLVEEAEWAMGIARGAHGGEWEEFFHRGSTMTPGATRRLMAAYLTWRGIPPPRSLRPLVQRAQQPHVPPPQPGTYGNAAVARMMARSTRPDGSSHSSRRTPTITTAPPRSRATTATRATNVRA